MRLFVDCEFNGFGGDLISIALVGEDGREFYRALTTPHVEIVDWVARNVIPVLGREPDTREDVRAAMHGFLSGYVNPIVIADWYTDLVHFFSLFEGPDHGSSIEYACRAELVPTLESKPETPHNALSDARAIRDAYLGRAAVQGLPIIGRTAA